MLIQADVLSQSLVKGVQSSDINGCRRKHPYGGQMAQPMVDQAISNLQHKEVVGRVQGWARLGRTHSDLA